MQLSTADRIVLDGFHRKGVHLEKEVNRVHLLIASDSGNNSATPPNEGSNGSSRARMQIENCADTMFRNYDVSILA